MTGDVDGEQRGRRFITDGYKSPPVRPNGGTMVDVGKEGTPAGEAAALSAAGWTQDATSGVFWSKAGSTPVPYQEALVMAYGATASGVQPVPAHVLTAGSPVYAKTDASPFAAVATLSALVAARHPSGWKSTEFWSMVSVVVPCLIAGVTAMAGGLTQIPEQWRSWVGLVLMGVSGVLSALYMQARTRVKVAREGAPPRDAGGAQ
jgi:hypothetical protein